MKRQVSYGLIILSVTLMILSSGCSYFNTYYNIKKKFREAEREYNRRPAASPSRQESPPGLPGQGGMPARPAPQNAPIDKYRKVIETAAKLLEYYPKSRWVDDTLLLMGIAYFRLQDYSRAERKFTELTTIFPNSEHVPEAVIWKARTLVEQGKLGDATDLLNRTGPELKDRSQRGQVEFLLAKTEFEQKHWDEAATHFKLAMDLLPAGEDRYEAIYKYGVSQFERKQFKEAADSFSEVARLTRNRERAFEAHIFSARSALASGDKDRAEQVLLRLKQNSVFDAFAGDVDLELANLAVESGRVDEGIEFYQKYLDEHPEGEKRGLAFFRLANVYRKHRLDLQQSKALLDSAMRAGGGREFTDSARAAHEKISQGLQELVQFRALQDTIIQLEARRVVLKQQPEGLSMPVTNPTEISPVGTASVDTTVMLRDSSGKATPALIPSDSLLQALRKDKLGSDSMLLPGAANDSVEASKPPPADAVEDELHQVDEKLALARARHQRAALRVAEFYEFSLQERESALAYYGVAAASPYDPDVQWKANLYLAADASKDSTRTTEARRFYQAVINAESVPIEVANIARHALGLPLLEVDKSRQEEAFRAAEQANFSGALSADSVIRLYGTVIAYDSTSHTGMSAMFAQMHIYENVLQTPDSAKMIAERLIALFPDSSFTGNLRTRILPPDTVASIFSLSDEQLYRTAQPQESVIEETSSEDGWPPSEETLRGRRFE